MTDIECRNLITGEPAPKSSRFNRFYFELEIVAKKAESFPYRFAYSTSQGEFLCAFDSKPTFKEAWFDALTYTTIGGDAYQAWESRPLPADPGTEPNSPVYQGEGFDPYAGNLDQLTDLYAEDYEEF